MHEIETDETPSCNVSLDHVDDFIKSMSTKITV